MKRALFPLAAAVLLAMPVSAHAAGPAAATISACKGDRMTVAGKVSVTGKARSRVRGAALQIRFQAMPLFGLPKASDWRDLGKKTAGSGDQEFTGLFADNWAGVLSWRFMKGRKKVLGGDERSQPVKVGSAKGKANCTLAEGAKPLDITAPTLFILPAPDAAAWHRAPTLVQLLAKDDFSGVKGVRYSLDGGPITELRNGSTFDLATEGAHTIQWAATDVAGNTATRSDVVQVDAAPPSKPVLSRPFSVTASTTPTFQWSASTDSGSGLGGYVLAIRRGDGSLVSVQTLAPGTTSVAASTALTDGATYTATVTAFDKATPAWTTDSDPLTFKVDTTPEVTSTDPAEGAVLAFARKSGNLTVTLDRPADPASVTAATVSLQRDSASGSSSPVDPPSCSNPCTTITIHPTSALPEGRYTLVVSGVKSQEGATIAAKGVKFAVPASESASPPSTSQPCVLAATVSTPVTTNAANETVLASFSYTLSGGTGKVSVNESSELTSVTLSPGSGNQTLSFSLPTKAPHPLQVQYCIQSGSGTLALQNLWVSRAP
jgi:hypothetical protein